MKVLIFSVVKPSFIGQRNGHNGGGWISSFEKILKKSGISIGFAFEHSDDIERDINGTVFFGMKIGCNKKEALERKLSAFSDANLVVDKCKEIINKFQPDIIQVFGTENPFGLIVKHTKIPVIIHIQGNLQAIDNARWPVGISLFNILLSRKISFFKKIMTVKALKIEKQRIELEKEVLKNNKFYMGRTSWDKTIIEYWNSNSNYFHCDELLRDSFLTDNVWKFDRSSVSIISTISTPLYKGFDLILKTALKLKRIKKFNFNWKVYGIEDVRFLEEETGINCKDVNIELMGVVDEIELKSSLLKSRIFVHPSYIDNSPNSICEAQILGVPVISTNVGGISSLIQDEISGFLIPANDPLTLTQMIYKIWNNEELLTQISNQSKRVAMDRHDSIKISKRVNEIYDIVLKKALR